MTSTSKTVEKFKTCCDFLSQKIQTKVTNGSRINSPIKGLTFTINSLELIKFELNVLPSRRLILCKPLLFVLLYYIRPSPTVVHNRKVETDLQENNRILKYSITTACILRNPNFRQPRKNSTDIMHLLWKQDMKSITNPIAKSAENTSNHKNCAGKLTDKSTLLKCKARIVLRNM